MSWRTTQYPRPIGCPTILARPADVVIYMNGTGKEFIWKLVILSRSSQGVSRYFKIWVQVEIFKITSPILLCFFVAAFVIGSVELFPHEPSCLSVGWSVGPLVVCHNFLQSQGTLPCSCWSTCLSVRAM